MRTEVKNAAKCLALALVVVMMNASLVNGRNFLKHDLLQQIFHMAKAADHSKAFEDTYVDVVFNKTMCQARDFCIAQKIISHATAEHHHYSLLARALRAYCKMERCPYTPSGVKYPLSFLTADIIHCVQNMLSTSSHAAS